MIVYWFVKMPYVVNKFNHIVSPIHNSIENGNAGDLNILILLFIRSQYWSRSENLQKRKCRFSPIDRVSSIILLPSSRSGRLLPEHDKMQPLAVR
jgi:hypothetical protein